MPWSDKAVSPCVYTPGAGEMVAPGMSVSGGKLVDRAWSGENLEIELIAESYVPNASGTTDRWYNRSGVNLAYFETENANRKPVLNVTDKYVEVAKSPTVMIGNLTREISQPMTTFVFGKIFRISLVIFYHDQETSRIATGFSPATGNSTKPEIYTSTGSFTNTTFSENRILGSHASVLDGSSSKIYINGNDIGGSGNIGTAKLLTTKPMVLFNRFSITDTAYGYYAQVKCILVYAAALSQAQIQAVHAAAAARYPGVV